jgi:outer membrane protein assembly factor BamB
MLETEGLMTCYDAKDGERIWEKDLRKIFMASPSLVGDNVYLMAEDGTMIIIKAGREFKELRRCELGENSRACPAFLKGQIYIRGEENLYCIAE